jgi:hypothetical protein
VIKIKIGPRKAFATVLTGVVVTRVDVEAGEANVPLGHSLVRREQQDPGDANESAHGSKAFVMNLDSQVSPAIEIEGVVLLVNGASDALVEQRKSAFYRGNMDRQVGPI